MNGEDDDFEQLTMFQGSVTVEVTTIKEDLPITQETGTTSDIVPKPAKSPALRSKSKPVESQSQPKEKNPMQAVEQGIDFEASLTKLETVVKELDGEVKLEEALKLFEEGIKLSVECEKFIKSAEQRIEILKKQADGTVESESFENETAKLLAGE